MFQFILHILIFLSKCYYISSIELSPQVYTSNGYVQGTVEETETGKQYFAYRGIPYAKPPIHDLRFEPPEPLGTWDGVLNATNYGPVCPQSDELGYEEMSEDCLTLNIFTPQVSSGNLNVIIFVNGEMFNEGAARDVGPDYFMYHDCVLVTLNYRLNIFGFISTGTRHAPGNIGLKDQSLALIWLQNNINSFGGNPYTSTLMGHGSGAMSNTLHFVSPLSSGSFGRMIVMSGSTLSHYQFQKHNLNLVKEQAKNVNCTVDDIETMVKCLKRIDFRILANGYRNLTEWGPYPYKTWFPVIERYFGQLRFMPEDPIYRYRQGKITYVPFLIGITKNETSFLADKILANQTMTKDFRSNFSTIGPICFLYEKNTKRSAVISDKIYRKYLETDNLNQSIRNLFSDSHIRFGVYRFVDLLTLFQKAVYVYQNSLVGRYSKIFHRGPTSKSQSNDVFYGDDLQFFFPLPRFNISYKPSDPEFATVLQYTNMWLNFARQGNPLPGSPPKWPTFNKSHHIYMDLNERLELRSNFPDETIKFWEETFPLDPIFLSYDIKDPQFWIIVVFIAFGITLLLILIGMSGRMLYFIRKRSNENREESVNREQNEAFELTEREPQITTN
uniref:carboxylesterase n=1 Tax=Culicoides sonorensis TaxID=179676 RepID=A0A336K9Q0_CULSO